MKEETKTIHFAEVEQAVANGAKFYDVRPAEAYKRGHFVAAEFLSLEDLAQGKFPKLDKETPLYLHCTRGMRSAQAAQLLEEAGFTRVYNLGGLEQVEAMGGVLNP